MKDEALRLALEALKEINKLSIGENAICLPAEIDTAMDAIKQALEQPEPEPVAWMNPYGGVIHKRMTGHEKKHYTIPLYTSPPKREPLTDEQLRECSQAMDAEPLAEGWMELIKFARAIEAAHGIKGEA